MPVPNLPCPLGHMAHGLALEKPFKGTHEWTLRAVCLSPAEDCPVKQCCFPELHRYVHQFTNDKSIFYSGGIFSGKAGFSRPCGDFRKQEDYLLLFDPFWSHCDRDEFLPSCLARDGGGCTVLQSHWTLDVVSAPLEVFTILLSCKMESQW